MNGLDLFLLIIFVIGGLNGLRQGFVKAFANLVGWFLALVVAAKFTTVLAPSMQILSEDPVIQKIAAFAFIVLVIVICTWLVTGLLNRVLKKLKLGPLNRLVGGTFGTLKGLLIVLITMQAVSPWVAESPTWKHSKFVQALLPYAPWATAKSKQVAAEAMQHFDSKDATSSSESASERGSSDASTKNPFN